MKSGIEQPGRRVSPEALSDRRDKLREVAAEAVGKAACRLVVCIGLFPGLARIEDIAIDAFDRDRDREAEIGVDTELRLLKLARQRELGRASCRERVCQYV